MIENVIHERTLPSPQSGVAGLLERIDARVEDWRSIISSSEPRFAPRFNVFEWIAPNELKLSMILADLLDPKGTHGQGDVLLDAFLKTICDIANKPELLHSAIVRREVCTREGRRMDIVVDVPGGILLAIENKPRAADQLNQLRDYKQELDDSGRKTYLVYVPGTHGRLPSERSVSAESAKGIIVASYRELQPWLRRCIGTCLSERVRMFLQDFVDYIDCEFCGVINMTEQVVVENEIIRDERSIRAALSVERAMKDVRLALLKNLRVQLQSLFDGAGGKYFREEHGWTISFYKFESAEQYGTVLIAGAESPYGIAFQFNRANYADANYGIFSSSPQIDADGTEPKDGWWLNERVVGPRYWWGDSDVWANIVKGTQAEIMFEQFHNILRDLQLDQKKEHGSTFLVPRAALQGSAIVTRPEADHRISHSVVMPA